MICDEVGSRELITLGSRGLVLRGTYHKATNQAGNSKGLSQNRTGIVFLSALSWPRSFAAGAAVSWADSFAARGYPSFRIDLPGLGDSYGETPNDLLAFVNDGGYSSIVTATLKELVERFGISQLVLFGHCAGATNAIYAASQVKECSGLVLTDPYFNLPKRLTPRLSPDIVLWIKQSRVGTISRAIYDRLREFPRAFRMNALPADANVAFIAHWKKVVLNGLPILILKSPHPVVFGSERLKSGCFDYLAYINSFAVRRQQITVRAIEETDHSFANRLGRLAVQQNTEAWLAENFPITPTHLIPSQDETIPPTAIDTVATFTPVPVLLPREMGAQ